MSGEPRTENRAPGLVDAAVRRWLLPGAQFGTLGALVLGALLVALLYQVPARHDVNIGGYDAAYVQGFHDPQVAAPGAPSYLDGSDGGARWTRAESFLLFPQSGLPGSVTLRLRGWRADGPPPQVSVLLNGRDQLGTFQASGDWEEHSFIIEGGLLKATDIFVAIRAETTRLAGDGRVVGVLLDRAVYRVAPGPGGLVRPYPTQMVYGGLAAALLWLLLAPAATGDRRVWLAAAGLLLALFFLFLYRLQPPVYPYPLRWLLPAVNLGLGALLLLRHGPSLAARRPWLPAVLAPTGVALWTGAVLYAAQAHLTLSTPGVEKDFRVFATRAESLAEVVRADGFYNLGYPLLLWLVRPLTEGNSFLAGRLVAAASGALLLLATYGLARSLLPRGGALLALLLLALSPLVVQYALYVGSDMPFAACVTLALALLLAGIRAPRRRPALLLLAGLAGGGAFLMRHSGLVLLPWGLLVCALLAWHNRQEGRLRSLLVSGALFVGGFLLTALPQLAVNTVQNGQPLFNQQAKNAWLAVYGDIDWGRWDEAPNTISLAEVVLRDPVRFWGNWWRNLQGFTGSGAEDTSEFGRALQLRLLGWPANWLALIGVLIWLYQAVRWRGGGQRPAEWPLTTALLLFVTLFVALASIAFLLPRFLLPLAPIYAVAAAWATLALVARLRPHPRAALAVGLALAALLWGGFGVGTRYVLDNQPAEEVAMLRLTLATLQPGERLVARVSERTPIAKYSALAHRVLPWPAAAVDAATLAQARAQGATYLLWDEAPGPPPLPDTAAARVGGAGGYSLYRLTAPVD